MSLAKFHGVKKIANSAEPSFDFVQQPRAYWLGEAAEIFEWSMKILCCHIQRVKWLTLRRVGAKRFYFLCHINMQKAFSRHKMKLFNVSCKRRAENRQGSQQNVNLFSINHHQWKWKKISESFESFENLNLSFLHKIKETFYNFQIQLT